MDTPSRERLSKKIGVKRLKDIEELILEKEPTSVIIETQSRARLRKKLGQAELDQIELAIQKGKLTFERR